MKEIKKIIPENWNSQEDYYKFNYKHKTTQNTFQMKIVKMGNQLIIHGLIIEYPDNPYGMQIKLADFIEGKFLKDPKKLFKKFDDLEKIVKKNLVFKFVPSLMNTQRSSSDTRRRRQNDPLRIGPVYRPGQRRPQRNLPFPSNNPFGNVGSDDLNPFGSPYSGSGTSGNLVGPSHPLFNGGRGRGRGNVPGVPNDARFDPFFGEPDDDHLQPPNNSGNSNNTGSGSTNGSDFMFI